MSQFQMLVPLAGVVALTVARFVHRSGRRTWAGAVAVVGVLTLLAPMVVWASIPVLYGGHTGLPYAGPDLLTEPGGAGRTASQDVDRLVDYLLVNQGNATYLAATPNAQTAAPIILATGEPVMAMGGFTGGDPILTEDELAELVADGEVRFFLMSPQRNQRQGNLTRWVAEHCTAVPREAWGAASVGGPGGPSQLFDCAESVGTYVSE